MVICRVYSKFKQCLVVVLLFWIFLCYVFALLMMNKHCCWYATTSMMAAPFSSAGAVINVDGASWRFVGANDTVDLAKIQKIRLPVDFFQQPSEEQRMPPILLASCCPFQLLSALCCHSLLHGVSLSCV
jgi:hypothetical protein